MLWAPHPELSGCIAALIVRKNFCAAVDTLIDQDGGCKPLCSNGHLDRSRCEHPTIGLLEGKQNFQILICQNE